MTKASKPAIDGDISRLLGMVQTGSEPGACARATHTSFAFPVWDGAKIDEREERETRSLPLVEKLIMLQVVPYFQGMSTDQLLMLAYACKEEQFPKGAIIYEQGDRGGVFYIVINGSVAIRQEKRKGLSVQTATVGRHNHFGEAAFFDNHRCSDSAVALEETWALSLDREPVIALARQNPDLSLELINALGSRLRETSYRVAELTQTHSRELHEIYDEFA
jgi:signal-transduction protein with cAMP-binding, CBS, and nucleotidyltransferase domain